MKREDFDLKKFKVDSSGKMTAVFTVSTQDGDVAYTDKHEVSSPRIIHPDLEDMLEDLREMLATANDLFPHRNLPKMAPKVLEHVDKLKTVFKTLDAEVIEGVTVTGLALQGDEDSRSVVITGKRDVKGKSRERATTVAMNSPKIILSADVWGFEPELARRVEQIIDEVHLYFAQRKSKQGEIAFPEEAKAEEEAA